MGAMPGRTGRRWFTPPRWTGAFTDYVDRRVDREAGTPERAVEITDAWVVKAQRRYGPDSWKTVNTMEAAAKRRDAAGDHRGALGYRRQVVDARRRHLGPGHRQTLSAEYALAGTLLGLDRPGEARPYADHALECYVAGLGPDDPATLASLRDLALTLARTGRLREAWVVARNLVDGTTRVHGSDHGATADARRLLERIDASLQAD